MATFHFTETTSATPEQFLAALTDFGSDRQKFFGNSSGKYLEVHEKGATFADVTEGSRGVWERLRYDWSDPRRVVLTTVDSNLWGGHSGHTYTLTPQPDGTTQIQVDVVRDGKNLKGRATAMALGSVGKGTLHNDLMNTIKAVEDRNHV
jgi:hypothetical protein